MEGNSLVLHTPVQHRTQLGLLLRVELHHVDLLTGVLSDVLESHQRLELVESPRGLEVGLGEEDEDRGGLDGGLVEELHQVDGGVTDPLRGAGVNAVQNLPYSGAVGELLLSLGYSPEFYQPQPCSSIWEPSSL